MENIIIITGSHDISAAENIVDELNEYRVYYFDATLTDLLLISRLKNIEYLAWHSDMEYPALVKIAKANASTFEKEIDKKLGSVTSGISIEGWQHLNLYYLFIAYHWYSNLWREMEEKLKAGRLHIFVNNNPTNYYWPSFIPSLLLLERLKAWGVSFSAYTYGARADESDVVINFGSPQFVGHGFDIVAHLPTCFYDIDYFNAECLASAKTCLNVVPKYWGVPVQAARSTGFWRIHEQQAQWGSLPAIGDISTELESVLDCLLKPVIATPDFRMKQVRQLCNLYMSQLISLFLLERFFSEKPPSKILLSDHDAGFHGPLLKFAENNNISVLVVPHSKTSVDIPFPNKDVAVLTHPLQGRHLKNSRGRHLLNFALAYPESFSSKSHFTEPIRKIGMLLNGLSLNGVQCTNFKTYMEGVVKINSWCIENGIELLIRCRPGQSLVEHLNRVIDVDRDMLNECQACTVSTFVKKVDLCIMYDAPTNAGIEFLRVAVPVLNTIPAPLGSDEACTTCSRVVPRVNVDETLEMLDAFIKDECSVFNFIRKQFADYMDLFKNSYPLRQFL